MVITIIDYNRASGVLTLAHKWNQRDHELFSHYISDNEDTIVVSY